jgi:hypothetical protein
MRQSFNSDISREEFEKVREIIENCKRKTRPLKHDLYDVTCGVLYVLSNKVGWRDVPTEIAPWRSVYEHYTQWRRMPMGEDTILSSILTKLDKNKELEYANSQRRGPRD